MSNKNIFNTSTEIPKLPSSDPKFLPPIHYPSEELQQFKNEILSIINENNKKLEEKIEKYKIQITTTENEYDKNTKRINSQYTEILNSQAQLNTRLDKLKGYDAFVLKTNDQITSHELRLNAIKTDLTKSIHKYDKIYLDNLILPGYIGEFSKYKNCQIFFDDVILQLSKLNSFKEKNILDLKSYKEKLEGCIKTFNLLVDNNSKANMKYSNEIGQKTEKNCKEMIEIVNERLMEMRLENSKYAIELKNKSLDLSKEWEKIQKIKEEISIKFEKEVNVFKTVSNNTINSFSDFKKEFGTIKHKFFELAEFIRDVRFRKNLGPNVQKREIKQVVKKITTKKKNSYDDSELKINNKEKEILNINFHTQYDKNNLRESHSQDVEHRIRCLKEEAKKNMNNNNLKRVNLSSEENESFNLQTSNNNNNNRYLLDVDLETNDKVIKELASELEQSASKFDKLNKILDNNDKKNNNILNKNIQPEKNEFIRKDLRSLTTKINSSYDGNKDKRYSFNGVNLLNIFDLKKGHNDLSKRINQIDKKVNEFENIIKQKVNELTNQIDKINFHNNNNYNYNNPINNNINFIQGNMTNYGNYPNNTYTQTINPKNNNKVPIVEIQAKFPNLPQPKKKIISLINQNQMINNNNNNNNNINNNNNNINNNNINNNNRVKTGRISSRVEQMINQTLDNISNNVNNNINFNNINNNNNNENTISFYPEYKVLKKVENKRGSVDAIVTTNLNLLNSDLNNNIQPTKWVQLNKITTNKPPKNNMKLGDLLKDD